jgi:hypothetical protein
MWKRRDADMSPQMRRLLQGNYGVTHVQLVHPRIRGGGNRAPSYMIDEDDASLLITEDALQPLITEFP